MTHDFRNASPLTDQQSVEILEQLELRCPTDVATTRAAAARRTKVGVTVRPADMVDRDTVSANAQTTELRRQGATCIASRPLMVGSIFHLAFDRAEVDVLPTLGLCERCSLLGDSSFELRFKFVQEIELPDSSDPCV